MRLIPLCLRQTWWLDLHFWYLRAISYLYTRTHFGPRCNSFDEDCYCCNAWKRHDDDYVSENGWKYWIRHHNPYEKFNGETETN